MRRPRATVDCLLLGTAGVYSLRINVEPFPDGEPALQGTHLVTIIPTHSGLTMTPEGALADCFDVYHCNQQPDLLDVARRRQWMTASAVDHLVFAIVSSSILGGVAP